MCSALPPLRRCRMQRTGKRVGVWCAMHLVRNAGMRWMCVCAKAAMSMRSAITMRLGDSAQGGPCAAYCATYGSCACASANDTCAAVHTETSAHAHRYDSAHAHKAHRHGLAHARTGSSAHVHLCGLAHAHRQSSAHAHTTNTALQARLTMLSAWVAHVTVYSHDLPCAKGSGAKRRDRQQ